VAADAVLAQTIAALTAVGGEVLMVACENSPNSKVASPALQFYDLMRSSGFELQDITETAEVPHILRTVKARYRAEQAGRGIDQGFVVVRMVRTV
jgi:hypothetical protein